MAAIQHKWHDKTAWRSEIENLNFKLDKDKRFTQCTINIKGTEGHVNGEINVEIGGKLAWSHNISLDKDEDKTHNIDLQEFINTNHIAWAPIIINGHISNGGVLGAGAEIIITVEYDSIISEQKSWSDRTIGKSNFENLNVPLEDEFKFTECLVNIEGNNGEVNGNVTLTIGGEAAWNSGISLGSGDQMSYYVDITQFSELKNISWAPVEVTGHISNAGGIPVAASVLLTVVKAKM